MVVHEEEEEEKDLAEDVTTVTMAAETNLWDAKTSPSELSQVKSLRVRQALGSRGCEGVGSLVPYMRALEHLKLDGTALAETESGATDTSGLLALCTHLSKACMTSRLQTLSLADNNIDCDGAKMVARVIQAISTVERVCLAGNNIGPSGTKALAKALLRAPNLRELDLARNNVRDRGAAQLAKALRADASLQRLVLADNFIFDEGAGHLCAALASNRVLCSLDLSSNQTGVATKQAFTQLMASHKSSLRELKLGPKSLDRAAAKAPDQTTQPEDYEEWTLDRILGELEKRSALQKQLAVAQQKFLRTQKEAAKAQVFWEAHGKHDEAASTPFEERLAKEKELLCNLQRENGDLEAKILSTEAATTGFKDEIAALQKRQRDAATARNSLDIALQNTTLHVESLVRRQKVLRAELEAKQRENAVAKDEATRSSDQIAALERQVRKFEELAAAAEQREDHASFEIDGLERELAVTKESSEILHEKLVVLKTERGRLGAQVAEAEGRQHEAKARLEIVERQRDEAREALRAASAAHESLVQDVARESQDHRDLCDRHEELLAERKSLLQRSAEIAAEKHELRAKRDEHLDQTKALRSQQEKLEAQRESRAAQISDLYADLVSLRDTASGDPVQVVEHLENDDCESKRPHSHAVFRASDAPRVPSEPPSPASPSPTSSAVETEGGYGYGHPRADADADEGADLGASLYEDADAPVEHNLEAGSTARESDDSGEISARASLEDIASPQDATPLVMPELPARPRALRTEHGVLERSPEAAPALPPKPAGLSPRNDEDRDPERRRKPSPLHITDVEEAVYPGRESVWERKQDLGAPEEAKGECSAVDADCQSPELPPRPSSRASQKASRVNDADDKQLRALKLGACVLKRGSRWSMKRGYFFWVSDDAKKLYFTRGAAKSVHAESIPLWTFERIRMAAERDQRPNRQNKFRLLGGKTDAEAYRSLRLENVDRRDSVELQFNSEVEAQIWCKALNALLDQLNAERRARYEHVRALEDDTDVESTTVHNVDHRSLHNRSEFDDPHELNNARQNSWYARHEDWKEDELANDDDFSETGVFQDKNGAWGQEVASDDGSEQGNDAATAVDLADPSLCPEHVLDVLRDEIADVLDDASEAAETITFRTVRERLNSKRPDANFEVTAWRAWFREAITQILEDEPDSNSGSEDGEWSEASSLRSKRGPSASSDIIDAHEIGADANDDIYAQDDALDRGEGNDVDEESLI